MDSVLEAALRKFVSEDHIRNVLSGQWVDLFDNHGHKLPGIRGRIGVSARRGRINNQATQGWRLEKICITSLGVGQSIPVGERTAGAIQVGGHHAPLEIETGYFAARTVSRFARHPAPRRNQSA